MKQVIQNFKSGELSVEDVPSPSLSVGMVLVENKFSLISAGTEKSTIKVAQSNLLGKAKQRPDLVAQVIRNLKTEGISSTIQKVRSKLDSLKALGYSTAGVVTASLDTQQMFKPGDRVACAGQDYASHAELVCVPQNLVAKIPDGVTFEEASFTTLGAIALQGIRQADVRLGEFVCVIGLGLLGQLTVQMLKANGCHVAGIDLSGDLVNLSKENGSDIALNRNDSNLLVACENFTRGYGFDSVIITAATSSNDPIDLAGQLCRKKGRVVVVGAVKIDVPRDPYFYRKELEVRMSCSYGPGRYDPSYEEHGIDYPIGYVRWTEQRNMTAFLDLIAQGSIKLKPLIAKTFLIDHAVEAYAYILSTNSVGGGILLKYEDRTDKSLPLILVSPTRLSKINVGLIGAGSFAQSYLIPNIKQHGASLETVISNRGINSKNVAQKFGFANCSTDVNTILNNSAINTVFIATPHAQHATQVIQALQAGKNVFVEKPLALNQQELEDIKIAVSEASGQLMVGFNRRFSPLAVRIKSEFTSSSDPLVITMRINAGFIPKNHWIQDPLIGGGRVIGEICHFIDLMQYLTNSEPVRVFADSISTDNSNSTADDNLVIIIKFKNGSIGNLTYAANGDKALGKEYIEVFGAGKVGLIDNFLSGSIVSGSKIKRLKMSGKGHKEEVNQFLSGLQSAQTNLIPFRSLFLTTSTTFKILDSLKTGLPQEIE